MRCGLYGKLPAKRDFVAVAAPREFLRIWEPWLQSGISASRLRLGNDWQGAFLHAPIWRFWLGAHLCGTTIAGAFMPSVDGVGRYFPLTAFACAEDGAAIPPPSFDTQEAWFQSIERLLLSALGEETQFDAIAAALDASAPPATVSTNVRLDGLIRATDGSVIVPAEPSGLRETLAGIRPEDHAYLNAAATFWWTAGGEAFKPHAVVGTRMPDPELFAGMLTGSFDAGRR
jgi:type VI secretion system protein ImpM